MVTLVSIAGIVACVLYRRQAPLPLTIAAAALAAIVAMALLEWIAEPMIYGAFGSARQGGLLVSNALGAMNLLLGAGRAAAVAGLICAVLAERKIDFQKIGW
jgi:hypothetical protein